MKIVNATYELWDVEVGNMIGTFATEADALAMIRELIILNGEEYADVLELGEHARNGDFHLVGTGAKLVDRAWTCEQDIAPRR